MVTSKSKKWHHTFNNINRSHLYLKIIFYIIPLNYTHIRYNNNTVILVYNILKMPFFFFCTAYDCTLYSRNELLMKLTTWNILSHMESGFSDVFLLTQNILWSYDRSYILYPFSQLCLAIKLLTSQNTFIMCS